MISPQSGKRRFHRRLSGHSCKNQLSWSIVWRTRSQSDGFRLPKFRAKQVWRWIWRHGLTNFDEMSDLSKPVRKLLGMQFSADRPGYQSACNRLTAQLNGLCVFLDGNEAECVYIPDKTRGTLCISSQVGCTLTCSFCHTGTQKPVQLNRC